MRKNILFSLFAMAALLFATSCQNEELFGGANVDTEVVSYTISTQELGTRADGTAKYEGYKLYWGVYEHVSNSLVYVDDISANAENNKAKDIEHGQVQVDIQLAKQKTYTIVFWAQHASKPMCVVDWSGRKVSFAQSLEANQKTYDAFWASDKDVTLNGASQKKVTLVRPFAQINIGAGDFDEFVAASGENTAAIVKSAIEVKNVPLGMDIETGDIDTYTETSTMTFAASDTLPSTEKFPVNGNQYIALGYVLADANQNLVDIKLTYTDEKGKTYSNEFTNVPVKRNHRTNIYGNLLTGNAGYDVEVDDNYGGDNNVEVVEVATASDLQETIENMEEGDSLTIVLTDDIDLGALFAAANGGNTGSNAPALRAGIESQVENEAKSLILAAGRSLTLDLNGKTITGPKKAKDAEGNRIHAIVNNGNLSIVGGGTLKAHDEAVGGGSAIYNYGVLVVKNTSIVGAPSDVANSITASYAVNTAGADSKLVVNNANISGRGAIGATDGAKVEINGGTYHTPAVAWGHAIYATDEGTEVVINDGTFSEGYEMSATNWGMYQIYSGNKAKVTVNGGTFMPWDCANGYDLCTATEGVIEIYGGSFAEDPSNQNGINYVANGYAAKQNENNLWTIVAAPAVVEGGYEISNAAQLKYFAESVNAGESTYNGTTIKLAADIDLQNETWLCIGTEKNPFSGAFNGNGKTIKNLTVIEEEAKEGKAFIGFFGYAKDAIIKNVTFENVNLNIACLDIDHSQGHIGAVAGSLEGTSTIENVTVKGDIKVEATQDANGASRVAVVAGGNSYGNVTMKNVHVIANEDSYLIANNNTGALAGQLQGKSVFENCSSNIDVTVNKFFAGGIIGLAAGDQKFTNCHTTGNIAVVAGREGRAHDQYRVGGIAGGWADGKNNVCTLVNCSYTGNVSGKNSDGSVANPLDYMGYVGRGYTLNGCQGSTVNIDGVRYVQKYNTADQAGIYDVYDVDGNLIVADGVVMNDEDEYLISKMSGMFWFANEVNVNKNSFAGKTVKLAANIDLENAAWTPVGQTGATTFNGVFDGQNYTISNLSVDSEDQTGAHYSSGLFGWVESHTAGHGHIKNVKINGATIKGHHNCGALVGYITQETALVENCHVTGATVSCTYANGDADGDKAGALIGNATVATPVKNCTAANSTVSSGRDAGQVIGAGREANVTGCSATEVTVTANGTGTGANIRNEVIGRLL